jgi:2',3'-cyclic-nucleotide 2'-phosphodiesterase (5'-nucleotidase family)
LTKRKLKFTLLTAIIILGYYAAGILTAKAEDTGTATLQIIATGDLHSQVTAYDYETGQETPESGLSKLATLIQEKESEAGANNTLLVDAGDFLYDYISNYFYDNYRDFMQPVMRAVDRFGVTGKSTMLTPVY